MECNIKCIEDNNGDKRYWCTNHRAPSDDKNKCLSEVKNFYNNIITYIKEDIKSIKIVYKDISEKFIPEIYINEKLIEGIIKIENSLIEPKDFGGLMLSKLNDIKLEKSICPYCNHLHSDDGKFAVMPHDRHLCQYCGKFFDIDSANIGNEIALYFDIPSITLDNEIIELQDHNCISYNIFNGKVLVNNKSVNKVVYNKKKLKLKDYLNKILEDKY